MKELTIKEKAQRYDEALERANAEYEDDDRRFRATLERIFPELKESEDEKMLREIKRYIKEQGNKPTGLPNGTAAVADMLAWLEKQGEQKPDIIIPKFRVGDTIRIKNSDAEYTITEISNGYYSGRGWCLNIAAGDECGDYELVEQNHALNDEDIRRYNSILSSIKYCSEQYPCKKEYDNDIDWLKSLKDRVQPQNKWKPSEEQMAALLVAVGDEKKLGSNAHKELYRLYLQLKKL